MIPRVHFELGDGELAEVGPGGLIGRLSSAALCIDDPRVSEAHAMVSLRGGRLYLLSLRGPLILGGQRVGTAKLKVGQRFGLVPGIEVAVVALDLPEHIVAVTPPGGEPVELLQSVYSLVEGGLSAGYQPEAAGWIWASEDSFRLQLREGAARQLAPGHTFEAAGGTFHVSAVAGAGSAATRTVGLPTATGNTRIVTRFETVHLHRHEGHLVIPGIGARILTELAEFGAPVPWEMVALKLWPEEDRYIRRQNWDRNLRHLRRRLRREGFRDDIVRPDGRGNVELYLLPGDEVVDEG